jgi:hypothetical protein
MSCLISVTGDLGAASGRCLRGEGGRLVAFKIAGQGGCQFTSMCISLQVCTCMYAWFLRCKHDALVCTCVKTYACVRYCTEHYLDKGRVSCPQMLQLINHFQDTPRITVHCGSCSTMIHHSTFVRFWSTERNDLGPSAPKNIKNYRYNDRLGSLTPLHNLQ